MSLYHVVIASERRAAPRPLATEVKSRAAGANVQLPIGNLGVDAGVDITQLHTMANRIDDMQNPNILHVAEWDEKSPFLKIWKGAMMEKNMAFSGWPMDTEEQWKLKNPLNT